MEEAIAKERESLASESAREYRSSVHSPLFMLVCLFVYPQAWSVNYPLLLRDLKNKLSNNYIRGISIFCYFLWAYDFLKAILTNIET